MPRPTRNPSPFLLASLSAGGSAPNTTAPVFQRPDPVSSPLVGHSSAMPSQSFQMSSQFIAASPSMLAYASKPPPAQSFRPAMMFSAGAPPPRLAFPPALYTTQGRLFQPPRGLPQPSAVSLSGGQPLPRRFNFTQPPPCSSVNMSMPPPPVVFQNLAVGPPPQFGGQPVFCLGTQPPPPPPSNFFQGMWQQ